MTSLQKPSGVGSSGSYLLNAERHWLLMKDIKATYIFKIVDKMHGKMSRNQGKLDRMRKF